MAAMNSVCLWCIDCCYDGDDDVVQDNGDGGDHVDNSYSANSCASVNSIRSGLVCSTVVVMATVIIIIIIIIFIIFNSGKTHDEDGKPYHDHPV